jgi:heme exporter protein A
VKPLLSFEDVACRRGGRLLFEGLDLRLDAGEALQVVGPNGSGKSSLIRLAAGLLRAERGRIHAAPLALADDNLALDSERTLWAALRFWGGEVDPALVALGLEDLAPVPVRLLSAGQGKRAALARVVASNARLWLLDEPANALDSASIELLAAAITAHRAAGGGVVAASHLPLPGDWRCLELRA